jgi:hypothetical protein
MTGIELDRGDAAELAELLTLLTDWLSGPDHELLSQSYPPMPVNRSLTDLFPLGDRHSVIDSEPKVAPVCRFDRTSPGYGATASN